MTETLFKEKYPIHTIEIDKTEIRIAEMDDIIAHYRTRIEAHPVATYIGIFDHYAHTRSLEDGQISDEILDAKNVLCCFGKELPSPQMLAVRPRAIGIAEKEESFVISFLEAPHPAANDAMIAWTKDLINSKES